MVEKEIGFVGDITSIQPRLLNTLVESGYLPVVASVAADSTGQALNVNADIAAGEVCSVGLIELEGCVCFGACQLPKLFVPVLAR